MGNTNKQNYILDGSVSENREAMIKSLQDVSEEDMNRAMSEEFAYLDDED